MKNSDHFQMRWFPATFLLVIIAISQGFALGVQTGGRDVAPRLPRDAASWVNRGPYSNEMLANKAAMFWFFEET